MRFEWDDNKNRTNQRKHNGVSFEIAHRVFEDDNVLIEPDRIQENGEERLHAIGLTKGLVLLVVHIHKETHNGEDIIRIISARAADKGELERYFRQAVH